MAIKSRRKIKVRSRPKPKKPINANEAIDRMGEILAAGHGTKEQASQYEHVFADAMLHRMQAIATRAEKERSWKFMDGCYKQATELYVLASALYEKFPDHVMLSDAAYDKLGRFLLNNRKNVDPEFWNWYNVTSMGLKAGTGYDLTLRKPVLRMIHILTGVLLEENDEPKSQDKAKVLRKPIKRRRKPTSGSVGTASGGTVRKRKIKRKRNTKD